jgi:uncharacterized protein
MSKPVIDQRRRQLLQVSLFGSLAVAIGSYLPGCKQNNDAFSRFRVPVKAFGPLMGPDSNGLLLPAGFESRVIARTGEHPVAGSSFKWHASPDGGATFASQDGGWIYVSNSEVPENGGGAGALRFNPAGQLVDAYSILTDTSRNCAGGTTPWGTWLSCEEIPQGTVWECDPSGRFNPFQLTALGAFKHEAAAVDPVTGFVYMSEDEPDGRFYRFASDHSTLNGWPDLRSGTLQVAEVVNGREGPVRWHPVQDPAGAVVATRLQVPGSTAFNRGEGLWFDSGFVYMATTGDNRIWRYDARRDEIALIFDEEFFPDSVLKNIDNLTVSPRGDILVAEDGDDLQLVAITPIGNLEPLVQLIGHDGSELTGPAFDPSGKRLYFSSQRGKTDRGEDGITFEITGPFAA